MAICAFRPTRPLRPEFSHSSALRLERTFGICLEADMKRVMAMPTVCRPRRLFEGGKLIVRPHQSLRHILVFRPLHPGHNVDDSRRLLIQPQHAAGERRVASAGEIFKGRFRDAEDVVGDKGSALARSVLGMLKRTFPFEHGPAVVIILRELRDTALKSTWPSPSERKRPARATQAERRPGGRSAGIRRFTLG